MEQRKITFQTKENKRIEKQVKQLTFKMIDEIRESEARKNDNKQ